ncbi:MAG: hypothetical protein IJ905_18020 [Fibrobacter sp.]|nr:hypothetical protein [Fibrobacter sp.]
MKFSHALILASSLAFFACGDDDDSPSAPSKSYDCSVTNGVKVVYPTVSEQFKMGDEITVVFGTDIEDNGYRIIFKKNAGDQGFDLLEEAYDAKMDGKTCNEVKVKLSSEKGVEPTLTGIIRVAPYNKQNKGNNSELFIVKE